MLACKQKELAKYRKKIIIVMSVAIPKKGIFATVYCRSSLVYIFCVSLALYLLDLEKNEENT